MWYAVPMPERPAPMMRTSRGSDFIRTIGL
jgi:hypothetical protein